MSTQPISAARIAANKANAQNSTGPRTAEGKARVSENAFKHGLRSERNPLHLASDAALPFEREEFQATLTAFLDEFAPASAFETRLVERLAQIDLRLQRAVRMETTHLEMHTGLLAKSMAGALPTGENAEQTQHNWLTTLAFLKNPSATTLLAQYESRLARDFARTLAQLRQSQALRARREAENRSEARNLSVQTQPAQQIPAPSTIAPASAPPPSAPTPPIHPDFANQTQAAPQAAPSSTLTSASARGTSSLPTPQDSHYVDANV
jgi:hypothetical protein